MFTLKDCALRPPEDTGEVCDYCGAAATRGPRWDSVLHATIDFTALPYCNWNVTTSTPRANFRNHVPLPLDHRPQRDWLNVGLFRDPRRRLVRQSSTNASISRRPPSLPAPAGGTRSLSPLESILAPARKMGRDAHCGGGWWPPYFCIPRPTPRPPSFLSDAGCQRPVRPVCFGKRPPIATTPSNQPSSLFD